MVDVVTEIIYFCSRVKSLPSRSVLSVRRGIYEKNVFDLSTRSGEKEGCFIIG